MTCQDYSQQLLRHYKSPKGLGEIDPQMLHASGTNPLCGDKIKLGVTIDKQQLTDIKYSARACSICIASSSIMTEIMLGQQCTKIDHYLSQLTDLYNGGLSETQLDTALLPLSAVSKMSGRKKCALLSWQALSDIVHGAIKTSSA